MSPVRNQTHTVINMNRIHNSRISNGVRKIPLLLIPIIFTAQSCNILTGGGNQGSGSVGVFLSVDSGDTWHPGKGNQKLQIGSAAISKLYVQDDNPKNLVAASINSGVLASADYGENWAVLLTGFAAYDVFINPFNSQEIFAGGAKGKLAAIYKSPDRGGTWIQVYNEPSGESVVTSLAFDPSNAKIMYAGLSTGTLLKSADGGDTWRKLFAFKDGIKDIGVAYSVVYALNAKTGLHRSQDRGLTWTDVKIDKTAKTFNDLFIDRQNSSVVYIGSDAGLFRTTDGGNTWSNLPLPASLKVSNVTIVRAHSYERSVIFAGVRSTVYRSDDNGSTWRTIQLSTNRVLADIAVDPQEPNRLYAGLRL